MDKVKVQKEQVKKLDVKALDSYKPSFIQCAPVFVPLYSFTFIYFLHLSFFLIYKEAIRHALVGALIHFVLSLYFIVAV